MKYVLCILLSVVFMQLKIYSQYQELEATRAKDFVYLSYFTNSKFCYYDDLKYDYIEDSLDLRVMTTGILASYDFESNIVTKTEIKSSIDSINYFIMLIEHEGVAYTIRLIKNNLNDYSPLYYLEKRTSDLSTVLDSKALEINDNINILINSVIDAAGILNLKTLQTFPQYSTIYYSINMNSGDILTSYTDTHLEDVYFFEINDTSYLSMNYTTNRIVYTKKDFSTIIKQLPIDTFFFFINNKMEIIDSTLYLSGIRLYASSDEFSVYKHKINSDTCTLVFSDTNIYNTDPRRAYKALSILDTNYIYAGTNFYNCGQILDNSCVSWFKIYCISSSGQLHWSKDIGVNDGYNLLMEIHSTQDTGCLALFYRYTDIDSARNGDFYWLKYDKYGNEDSTFLKGFEFPNNDLTNSSQNVLVYPNPTKDIVNFIIPDDLINPILDIFDLNGKIVHNSRINNNRDIKLEHLSDGVYLYTIRDNQKVVSYGKLVKE